MPQLTQSQFDAFKGEVDEPVSHRERECQEYVVYAADLLLPKSPRDIVAVKEERNFFGRTDLTLAADINDGTGRTARHAYIYELKAPQCYLFEMDTQARCRPTVDFFQAEN